MSFKSSKQRAYLYANHPEIAKRWEAETPNRPLPERVKRKNPLLPRPKK
jgi:hypothetical protein